MYTKQQLFQYPKPDKFIIGSAILCYAQEKKTTSSYNAL